MGDVKRGVIAVDCDNILADTARAFIQYYNAKFDTKTVYEDIKHAYLHENEIFADLDWSREAYYTFFVWAHKEKILEPMPGSQKGILDLKSAGYRLEVVTARLDKQLDLTKMRLDIYFPKMFDGIHLGHDMTEKKIPKSMLCKSIDAALHIDDFLHYANEIVVEDIPVILLDCPWNAHMKIESPLIMRVLDRSTITPDFVQNIIDETTK